MRVYLYSHTPHGGHRRYVEDLAEGLATVDDVVIVTSEGAPSPPPNVEQRAVLRPLDLDGRGLARIVDRWRAYTSHPRRLGRVLDVDAVGAGVVHFQELPTATALAAVRAARRRMPAIVTVHNAAPHSTGIAESVAQRLLVPAWRAADAVVVHSEVLAQTLSDRLHIPPGRIAVVPHAVWRTETAMLRPQGRKDFLFFGHLRDSKGPDAFVHTLAALGDPPASMIGRGSASTEDRLRRLARDLGIRNLTLENRFVDDDEIPAIFHAHRVLVAPYQRFEAQSGVTHLAVAHGIAQAVTPVGALSELVDRYGVGVVARGLGVSDIATAMTSALMLAGNPELSGRLEAARSGLRSDRIAVELHGVYSRALAAR